jgi:hypothetical protein
MCLETSNSNSRGDKISHANALDMSINLLIPSIHVENFS